MTKTITFVQAVMIGAAVEAALCAISVVSVLAGGFGPCGPTGDVPGLVQAIHQPGFWLAGLLVEDSHPAYLLLAVIFTTVFLSILVFVALKFAIGRNQIRRPEAALNLPPAATSVPGTPDNSKTDGDGSIH